MKSISILKHNLMRAAMTLALILACAAAWAQTTQSVTYIDENGQTQTVNATVLTGNESSLGSYGTTTWYVVNSNIHSGRINYRGNVNIILADGCTMTTSNDSGDGIHGYSNSTLTIYGQTLGTGTLEATSGSGEAGGVAIYSSGGDIIINGGTVTATATSSGANCINAGSVTINGGTVTATATGSSSQGINAGSVTINGGTVTASGTSTGIKANRDSGTITLGWTNTTDCIHASSYSGTVKIADGKALKNGGTVYYGTLTAAQKSAIANVTLQPATQAEFIAAALPQTGTNEYTIYDSVGWNAFCLALDDNDTWNRFSGKTVKLGADIGTAQDPITRMAGGIDHDMKGTFDGQGYTLTIKYGTAESPITADKAAPFVNVESGCIIENLHVAGDIYTSGKNAAGIAGTQYGAVTIRNCRVSTAIHSYTSGDGTHGGLVGNNGNGNGSALSIVGCVFDGKLLTEGATATIKCGGFVGWRHSEVTISNSLFAPTEVTIGTTSSATFARNGATITNCYYTTDFNDGEHFTAQGKQRHSITADENVTVAFSGTANEYQTSGITAYKDGNTQLPGLKYGDVLYAGNGDEVSLTLNNSIGGDVPEGYQYAYSTNAGTLDGSTLTMPDANVIVSVSTALRSTGQPVSITYGGHNQTHNAIALDGTESSLGESGQETWYFVGTDISHSGTIECSGKVNIILADGKTMTITSSDGHGIDVYNFLTVYGQELGTGTLNAINNRIGIYSNTGNITIRGGQVTATGDVGIYTQSGSVTIYGGQVTATGNTTPGNSGISAYTGSVTIYGGQVTATGSSGIYTYSGSVTINGGQVTANGSTYGIYAEGGNVTINGGQVTATGDVGIYTQSGGSVTINGGQVSAIGNNYGICAEDSNNITLGWTTASDYIYANTYYADYEYAEGTLSIAEGKAFIDEAGNTYSSTIAQVDDAYAIDGKWLYPNTVSRFTKTIAAHQTEEGVNYGWCLIASPLSGETNAEAVAHLVNSETPANFDLYRFNQAADLEWENWKSHAGDDDHYHFDLEPGRGYLYANAAEVNLVFAGTPYSGNGKVTLQKTEGAELSGWNLVGNPFTVSATLTQPYYRMNAEGSALKTETETTAVAAMEGVFVQANEDSQTVTFTAQMRGGEQATIAQANIMVGGDNGAVLDNAIIRFDGGQTLEKFSFREGSTKLYIPQDGKDYAIATSNGQGEMPLNFKAEENGTYTISVDVDNVEMGYLHLIDNMTGADVDLLVPEPVEGPASYTFTAKTTDYESRFKLVFAVGSSTGSDTFAFISNGNIIVNGEGTLQIFDVLGHQLVTKQLSTLNSQLSTLNYKSGVYVLRLINGENVRTQKIVIK